MSLKSAINHARRRREIYARRRNAILSVALAILVITGVAVVSFLPGSSKHLLHTRGRFHAHSWGHLLAFFAVSFTVVRIPATRMRRIIVSLGAILFGFLIEYGEHLYFHNPMEWKDVIVDTLGVVTGTVLAVLVTPSKKTA